MACLLEHKFESYVFSVSCKIISVALFYQSIDRFFKSVNFQFWGCVLASSKYRLANLNAYRLCQLICVREGYIEDKQAKKIRGNCFPPIKRRCYLLISYSWFMSFFMDSSSSVMLKSPCIVCFMTEEATAKFTVSSGLISVMRA